MRTGGTAVLRGLLAGLGLALVAGAAEAQWAQCRPVFQAVPPAMNACAGGPRVSLAVVGDVLLHRGLQVQGYARGFGSVWDAAVPFLRSADIAIANLEGPTAPGILRSGGQRADPGPVFDDTVYSSYPMFNYHPRVIGDLKAAGVDLVTTANNHALDRHAIGADLTVAELRRAGMAFVGTAPSEGPRVFTAESRTPLGTIVWIACTYSTNGIQDRAGQVLSCYEERAALLALVAASSARPGVAGVIVLPHWGNEYQTRAAQTERALARDLVAAGAVAVIGTHPHVVQDWELLSGRGIAAPVIYSTGNFVSGQVGLERQTGMLAWLTLCRGQAAPLAVERAGWVAMRMARTPEALQLIIADQAGVAEAALPSHRIIESRVPGRALMPRLECPGAGAMETGLR
ncbi:CapA family protein [Histidinibacterium lentulum]|uniref:CapA family protein n=1 Tax=Histidinibacterium lentulum TaxID=2480588 RepID=A0A3N2QTD7_9RHOB|nr:CapA family protein [Histidinibacterium lentulum]ROT98464.1 CapA family protein [Histidinibacterium lentulum]